MKKINKTLYCGNINKDTVMKWCIDNKKFKQIDIFKLGYHWLNSNKPKTHYTNIDHFLNGILAYIKENNIKQDDININIDIIFIDDNNVKTSIKILENGRIRYTPYGFFDQIKKARKILMGF